MILVFFRHVLSSFENKKKVYELHNIFQETDGKLRRWSQIPGEAVEEGQEVFYVSNLSNVCKYKKGFFLPHVGCTTVQLSIFSHIMTKSNN
jgi:hypothetical protein